MDTMPCFSAKNKPTPMTADQMEGYFAKFDLPEPTRAFIRRAVTSPPVRGVAGGGGNVTGRFISRKNGTSVDFESLHGEAALYAFLEACSWCLAYYAQAVDLPISFVKPDGKKVFTTARPDALVLSEDGPYLIECKFREGLERLSKERPYRWTRDESGRWTSPPVEAAAKELGVRYEIFIADDYQVVARNYEILSDFWLKECPLPSPGTMASIMTALSSKLLEPLSLQELLEKSGATISDIYTLIVAGHLHVELNRECLERRHLVHVWQSPGHARATTIANLPARNGELTPIAYGPGSVFSLYDKINRISVLTNDHVYFVGENQIESKLRTCEFLELTQSGIIQNRGVGSEDPRILAARIIIEKASPEALQKAAFRQQVLDGTADVKVPKRTFYYWKKKFKEGTEKFGMGFVGLLDSTYLCGGNRKVLARVIELAEKVIQDHYDKPGGPNRQLCRAELNTLCQAEGLTTPSQNWFNLEIKKRDQIESAKKRYGSGVAYQMSGALELYLSDAVPTHGDYFMSVGYIDHTLIDVEGKCSFTGERLGRAWLTVMVAGHNREVLACWLSYDPPSYVAVMQVIRMCLKRHGRCPRRIVLDGGKEFKSTDLQTIAAFLRTELVYRPGKKPRFGAIIEAIFGSTNLLLFHNLKGNTKIRKNVREIRPEVDPDNLAEYDLPLLAAMLEVYFFDIHVNTEHRSLMMTPAQKRAQSIDKHGERQHFLWGIDRHLEILLSPSVQGGTGTVIRGGQVTVHYFRYNGPILLNYVGASVPIRYDPFDISHVFVYVGKQWVECKCNMLIDLVGRSVCELKIATAILLKRRSDTEKNQTIKYDQLLKLLKAANSPELRLQRLKDQNLVPLLRRLAFDQQDTPAEGTLSSAAEPASKISAPAIPKPEALPVVEELPPTKKKTLAEKLAELNETPSIQLG